MKTVLTIAGSDCIGGAGIQADIKTMLANGVYAMSALTALTAQNTCGVAGIFPVTPEFLKLQLDSVFSDIRPEAVKIGMIPTASLIGAAAEKLKEFGAKKVVLDPVMVATSGARLIDEEAVGVLCSRLAPLADLLTPNIPEAEVLSGMKITDAAAMELAAEKIGTALGCAVLLKGGHSVGRADDLLYCAGEKNWFYGRHIASVNTHGTGCTLSSAIASNLAKGDDLKQAVARAKEYVTGALSAGLDLGQGSGPIDHGFDLHSRFI